MMTILGATYTRDRRDDCPGRAAVSVDGPTRIAWCDHCRWRGSNRSSYAEAQADVNTHNLPDTSVLED